MSTKTSQMCHELTIISTYPLVSHPSVFLPFPRIPHRSCDTPRHPHPYNISSLPPVPLTNGVQPVNTRDALLFSLMSSEVMADSRGYEILSAEEVEELKKVRVSPFRIYR